jgi:hypothetical protein
MMMIMRRRSALLTIAYYIDGSLGVHCHTAWILKMSIAVAQTTPLGQIHSIAVELLDAVIPHIYDVDIPLGVHRHTISTDKLTVAAAIAAPFG